MSLRQSQVVDEYGRPVPGATIYVFNPDTSSATLTSDGTAPLGQPVSTDEFGFYSYYAADNYYREDTYYGGKLRYKELVGVGVGTNFLADWRRTLRVAPGQSYPELDKANFVAKYFVGDAAGNPVPSAGTTVGADATLRTDLADPASGSALIKYKSSYANTYARSLTELKRLGIDDSDGGVNVMHFVDPGLDAGLVAGTNATDLQTYLGNAFTAIAGSTWKQKMAFPAGLTLLCGSGLTAATNGLIIQGNGATLSSPMTASAALLSITGDAIQVDGLRFYLSAGNATPWNINVTGKDCSLNNVALEKLEGTGGYQMYARYTADGLRVTRSRTKGSNGIYNEASNAAYLYNRFIGRVAGGDDCIAIKGVNDNCRNVLIAHNYIEYLAAGVSFGSEIGVFGANDSNYSRTVGQVVFAGNLLNKCASLAYFKPGAFSDYRDGTIEDVALSNNTLVDLTGAKFERGVVITPNRGARIRNIRGGGNIIRARSIGGSGHLVGALDIFLLDDAGGTAECSVSGVEIGIDYSDPYNGLSNSGARPGYPVNNVVLVVRNGAVGTVSDIVLDIRGNGSANGGLAVGFGIPDNAVRNKQLTLTNVNQTNSSSGGATLGAAVLMEGPWSVTPAFGPELEFGEGSLTPEFGRGGFNAAKPYQIDGVDVLVGLGAAIADAGGAAAVPTQAEFNALAATVNLIILRMRAGTPTISG